MTSSTVRELCWRNIPEDPAADERSTETDALDKFTSHTIWFGKYIKQLLYINGDLAPPHRLNINPVRQKTMAVTSIRDRSALVRRFGLWIVLVVLVVALSVAQPGFLTPFNLENVLQQNAMIGIVACGMAVMMISGGFDLSVGATGATSAIVAAFMANLHVGTFLTIASSLAIGLGIGFVNGIFIAVVKINAFVTTFATASIVSGLLFVITNANPISASADSIPELAILSTAQLGPIPVIFLLFLGSLVVVGVILTRTRYGHYIYSVGGNAEASHLSGVPVQRVQIFAFALGGMFAAGAGTLLVGQFGTAEPNAAGTWPLTAIAICVVGGVALTGGVGRIVDVLAATLLLGVVANGLNQLGVGAYWQPVVTGAVILVAVILDQLGRRRQAGNRQAPPVSSADATAAVVSPNGDEVRPITGTPAN